MQGETLQGTVTALPVLFLLLVMLREILELNFVV